MEYSGLWCKVWPLQKKCHRFVETLSMIPNSDNSYSSKLDWLVLSGQHRFIHNKNSMGRECCAVCVTATPPRAVLCSRPHITHVIYLLFFTE